VFGEDRVYTDLTSTLGGREVVSGKPSAQVKAVPSKIFKYKHFTIT